jgi:toxoflavin biosynthesis protein ToxD
MKLRDLELVSIPTAEFGMGSTIDEVEACARYWNSRLIDPAYKAAFREWILKEYPKHRVRVSPFLIGRFPVTNGEYEIFLRAEGKAEPESLVLGEPARNPVWGVTYEDATTYAEWLGARVGRACRLPTEAEWECAARGPSGNEYPYGQEFDANKCNTVEAGIGATTPVDFYVSGASEYGVFDMAGNVEEWTASFYAPYPGGRFIADDISNCEGRKYRVLRGGSFALGGDLARCARRHGPHPNPLFRYRGFRLLVT